jgi:hypothetical protein
MSKAIYLKLKPVINVELKVNIFRKDNMWVLHGNKDNCKEAISLIQKNIADFKSSQ